VKKVALLFAAALTCTPVLALADDATPAATSTTSSGSDDQNQIVCHRGEPQTGSRLPGPSVCHTKHDWDQIQKDSQGETNRMEMNGTLHNPQGR